MKNIVYDGSLEGFLTVIFIFYKELFKIRIECENNQISFFDQTFIKTEYDKAGRVENSIKKNISKEFFYQIKIAFRSDYKNKDIIIARLIKLSFLKGENIINSTNKYAIAFNKMIKNYTSEAHAFKGLLRFREIQEGFLFSEYESHNNILEDLSRHFLRRMPKEKFIIYDKNRKKAFISIYGNVEVVEVLNLDIEESDQEKFFQNLWIGFYDAISIKERKNKKLMISNMPKNIGNICQKKTGGEMKNNISDYQIIGGVIAYIIVMIISWLKKLPTNAPNAIFTAIVFSGMIYKIFIKKEKNNMFFNILTMIGSFILMIVSFLEML